MKENNTAFLERVAQDIIEKYGWENLREVTLIFPSHRAGLVLKEEIKKRQKKEHPKAVFLPQITTLSELFDALSPRQSEEEVRLICRLYHIYQAVTKEQVTLDVFYSWGRQMIADFNNIDKAVPTEEQKAFFENTIAARELEQLKLDEEVSQRLKDLIRANDGGEKDEHSLQHKYEQLWRNLYTIFLALKEELSKEGRGYEGGRMADVVAHLDAYIATYEKQLKGIEKAKYCFVGFNYLLRVEKELMKWFKANRETQFYWDYVEDFKANGKAFAFAKMHSKDLGNAIEPYVWEGVKEVDVYATTTGNAQAQFVRPWLKENYEKGERTAIVIADENMLEPVIYALPEMVDEEGNEIGINITKGFPLSNTQVYARIMAALDAGKYSTDLKEKEIEGILNGLLQEVDKIEREKGWAPEDVLSKIAEQGEEEKKEKHPDFLPLLLNESFYQMRCAINQFKGLIKDELLKGVIRSTSMLRNLLQRYLSGITLPFNGEPTTDVHVMGVLETRLIDFDKVLILNVEEGVVPQKESDTSFIPYYLRKIYHIPTKDEGATVYSYNFFRLMTRAKKVSMVYSEAETAMGRKAMSRFVMQMLVHPEYFRVKKHMITEAGTHWHINDKAEAENAITKLSPSAISTYISCARRFYWQYIEKIDAPQEKTLILAANTLGSIVHKTLEILYQGKRRIEPEWIKSLLKGGGKNEQVNNAIEEAFKSVGETDGVEYDPNEHTVERIVIYSYVKNVLEKDLEDAEKEGLEILASEQRFSYEVEGVKINGIVDRIDRVGEKVRVVDYKTGTYSKEKMSAKPENLFSKDDAKYVMQTLIYAEGITKRIENAIERKGEDEQEEMYAKLQGEPLSLHLYFTQRDLCKIDTNVYVKEDKNYIGEYLQVREDFTKLLSEKVQQIKDEIVFEKCTEYKKCETCPFAVLCEAEEAEDEYEFED